MQIDYISDLHVNHYVRFQKNQTKWETNTREWAKTLLKTGNPTSDTLILAGDFSEWNRQTIWLLEEFSKKYKDVLVTLGNHDLYLLSKSRKNKYKDSIGRKKDLICKASSIDGVTVLDRSLVEIQGKKIAGDSLWYLPKTQEGIAFLNDISNDSNYISILNEYSAIEVAKKLYNESIEWYKTLKGQRVDLMISHIPPVHPPSSTFGRNECYECEVPFLAADKWISGHQHTKDVFSLYGTTFYMNPLGYPEEGIELKLETLKI